MTIFASIDVAGGTPDVLLLSLLAIALAARLGHRRGRRLLRRAARRRATLDTLGVSALLYALAGYWIGRYGETTGRDRAHAPLLAVVVVTIAIAFAGLGLHFLLGEEVSARRALFDALLAELVLNLLLARPVFALCRSLLRRPSIADRVTEVRLLG